MYVAGSDDYDIITELKIRHSTLLRWREKPSYQEAVMREQQKLQKTFPLRVTQMFNNCLYATSNAFRGSTYSAPNANLALNILKSFGKEGFFGAEAVLEPPETVPKLSETVPKRFQKVPKRFPKMLKRFLNVKEK